MDVMPIEQLKHAAGNLNEFEIARIVFQKQQTRYSQRISRHECAYSKNWNTRFGV